MYVDVGILTYSMVQSPSWAANWFAASQEIPRISRTPKVHYRTHKRPPPVSILGQSNPVNIPTSHLLELHPNIVHPSTPRSPQWSLSLRFPHQDPFTPSPHPYVPHAQDVGIAPIILNPGTWWGLEMNFTALPFWSRFEPRFPLCRRLGGLHGRSGRSGEENSVL